MDKTRIEQIAEATQSLPTDEREAFLDEACGGDTELRTLVTALIDDPLSGDGPSFADLEYKAGDIIGPYTVIKELGAGGMGTVFLAEQSHPVARKVALKVVKLGMDTRDVLARFEAERKALALMNHPNVASVLDAGATDAGRPYFVMEFVPGQPITEFCDQNRLRISERLGLFRQLCDGVMHAHQKGIIHRDLKPNNILVADDLGRPLVKIIDFGVAKSTVQKFGETLTAVGAFIGTPHYTAPEQAGLGQVDIDTRADVYSMGVVLYELLVGQLPFDRGTFNNKSFEEICRVLREVEPPTPSARLGQAGMPERLAERRNVDISQLKRRVKGDLSWIVMKAMHKDREERYQTVSAFAADIRRLLDRHPVSARAPRAGYRARKFVERHKVLVGSVVAIVVTLAVGLVQTLIARAEAEREAALAAATSSLLTHILSSADPWNQDSRGEITVLQVIRELEQHLDRDEVAGLTPELARLEALDLEGELQHDLRQTIARVFLSLNENEAAARNASRARQQAELARGPNSLAAVRAATIQARALERMGAYRTATEILEPISTAVELGSASADQVRALVGVMEALRQAAANYSDADALRWATGALQLAESRLGTGQPETVRAALNLVSELTYAGEFEQARQLAQTAVDASTSLEPANPGLEVRAINTLAIALAYLGDVERASRTGQQAVERARRMFGDDHLQTARAMKEQAVALKLAGSYQPALVAAERARQRFQTALGDGSSAVRGIDRDLIDIRFTLGHYASAEQLARDLIARLQARSNLTGANAARFRLAQILTVSGQPQEAVALAEEVLAFDIAQGMANWNLALDRAQVAEASAEAGDFERAERLARSIIDDDPEVVPAMMVLAKIAAERSAWETVVAQTDRAIEIDLEFGGENYPDVAVYRLLRAEAALSLDQVDTARALAEQAAKVLTTAYGADHWQTHRGHLLKAMAESSNDVALIQMHLDIINQHQGVVSLDGRRMLRRVVDYFESLQATDLAERYGAVLATRADSD